MSLGFSSKVRKNRSGSIRTKSKSSSLKKTSAAAGRYITPCSGSSRGFCAQKQMFRPMSSSRQSNRSRMSLSILKKLIQPHFKMRPETCTRPIPIISPLQAISDSRSLKLKRKQENPTARMQSTETSVSTRKKRQSVCRKRAKFATKGTPGFR